MEYSDSHIGNLIAEVFSMSDSKWHTAGGISRITGIPESKIIEYASNNPENFKVPPIAPPTGSTLFCYVGPRTPIVSSK